MPVNHYQLKFKFPRRMKSLKVEFKIQIKSKIGQSEIVEFERMDKQYTQLATSAKPLGKITSADITLKVTGLNRLSCFLFGCKLGIVRMEVKLIFA